MPGMHTAATHFPCPPDCADTGRNPRQARRQKRAQLMAQADQLGAPVVKLTIECRRGRDG